MKTLVVYQTYLGSTKKYTEWLEEELIADTLQFKEVTDESFSDYDLIIVASGTYVGRMPLVKFLKDHWERLRDKEVIVIAVGIAPPDSEESKASYELIPEDIRKRIKYFKIPGKLLKITPMGEPSKEKLVPIFEYIQGL